METDETSQLLMVMSLLAAIVAMCVIFRSLRQVRMRLQHITVVAHQQEDELASMRGQLDSLTDKAQQLLLLQDSSVWQTSRFDIPASGSAFSSCFRGPLESEKHRRVELLARYGFTVPSIATLVGLEEAVVQGLVERDRESEAIGKGLANE